MEISFRSSRVFAVLAERPEERLRFFCAVQRQGVPVPKRLREIDFSRPRDTCLFAVDLRQKKLAYMAEPHICAAMVSSGVRILSVPEFLRLEDLGFPRPTRCPVFHVPHDGGEFPAELMEAVCIPEEAFRVCHEAMRDVGVWALVPRPYRTAAQCVRFPVSRLLCDVERFLGPEEVMERYGMGFCYERAFDGTRIKTVTEALREKTLVYYRAHHGQVDRICRAQKHILLFDMHSYSDEIVPKDFLREGTVTPDVCIGTDPRFTPPALAETAERHFRRAGFSTARNYPYAGCFVPNAVLAGEADGIAVMLEFHRRVYCDGGGTPIPEAAQRIARIVQELTAACAGL